MTEQRGIVAQHLFFQYPELREAKRQCYIIAEITQIAEMVGYTLAFQQQCAQPQGMIRRRGVGDAFRCHRIRPCIGYCAVAAHPTDELRALLQRHALETFLDALVGIAETLFKTQHLFTNDGKTEMPRFDDTRMHRPHRNFVHSLAFYLREWIIVQIPGTTLRRIEILAQREAAAVQGGMAQPFAVVTAFMCVNAKQVIYGALHAIRRREYPADVGIARLFGGQWHTQTHQPIFVDQHYMQCEAMALRALIAAPQRDQSAM